MRLWNTSTWKLNRSWGDGTRIVSMAYSAKGELIAAGLDDGGVCVREVDSGKEVLARKEHLRRVVEVAFTPDGKTLVSGSEDRTVRLWHVASGRGLTTWRSPSDMVSALAITLDGNTIAIADREGHLELRRAPSWARIAQLKAARTGKGE
jgi:WD40 repeat protein